MLYNFHPTVELNIVLERLCGKSGLLSLRYSFKCRQLGLAWNEMIECTKYASSYEQLLLPIHFAHLVGYHAAILLTTATRVGTHSSSWNADDTRE